MGNVRRYCVLIVSLVSGMLAYAQTTPNLGLQLPNYNSPNWGTALNFNFSRIDGYLSGAYQLPSGVSFSGITPGDCVTAGTGGTLQTTGSQCVATNPTVSQTVTQPAGTSLSLNGTVSVNGSPALTDALGVALAPTASQTVTQPSGTSLSLNGAIQLSSAWYGFDCTDSPGDASIVQSAINSGATYIRDTGTTCDLGATPITIGVNSSSFTGNGMGVFNSGRPVVLDFSGNSITYSGTLAPIQGSHLMNFTLKNLDYNYGESGNAQLPVVIFQDAVDTRIDNLNLANETSGQNVIVFNTLDSTWGLFHDVINNVRANGGVITVDGSSTYTATTFTIENTYVASYNVNYGSHFVFLNATAEGGNSSTPLTCAYCITNSHGSFLINGDIEGYITLPIQITSPTAQFILNGEVSLIGWIDATPNIVSGAPDAGCLTETYGPAILCWGNFAQPLAVENYVGYNNSAGIAISVGASNGSAVNGNAPYSYTWSVAGNANGQILTFTQNVQSGTNRVLETVAANGDVTFNYPLTLAPGSNIGGQNLCLANGTNCPQYVQTDASNNTVIAGGGPPNPTNVVNALLVGTQAGQAMGQTAPALTTATGASGQPVLTIASGNGIAPADNIYGAGIPLGATVQQLNGTTLTLSANTTAALSSTPIQVYATTVFSATGTASSGSSTLTLNYAYPAQTYEQIAGAGIPSGTTIANISGTTVTLSQNTTAALSATPVMITPGVTSGLLAEGDLACAQCVSNGGSVAEGVGAMSNFQGDGSGPEDSNSVAIGPFTYSGCEGYPSYLYGLFESTFIGNKVFGSGCGATDSEFIGNHMYNFYNASNSFIAGGEEGGGVQPSYPGATDGTMITLSRVQAIGDGEFNGERSAGPGNPAGKFTASNETIYGSASGQYLYNTHDNNIQGTTSFNSPGPVTVYNPSFDNNVTGDSVFNSCGSCSYNIINGGLDTNSSTTAGSASTITQATIMGFGAYNTGNANGTTVYGYDAGGQNTGMTIAFGPWSCRTGSGSNLCFGMWAGQGLTTGSGNFIAGRNNASGTGATGAGSENVDISGSYNSTGNSASYQIYIGDTNGSTNGASPLGYMGAIGWEEEDASPFAFSGNEEYDYFYGDQSKCIGCTYALSWGHAANLGAVAYAVQIDPGTNNTPHSIQFGPWNFLTDSGAATFSSITDTGLLSAAVVGTSSTGLLQANTGTISNATTGNAATATAFSATPAQCTTGEYATGVTANGTANCSTPPGSTTVSYGSASGCAFANDGNGLTCAGVTVTLSPAMPNTSYHAVCSVNYSNAIITATSALPSLGIAWTVASASTISVDEAVASGSSTGFGIASNYGVTIACSAIN